MNPVEEFLLVKEAASFPRVDALPAPVRMFGTNMGESVAKGFGEGIGTAALAATGQAVSGIYNAITAKRDFRNMLEWNQDLHDADPRLLNQSFRTLRRFAPDLSKDPLVAGSMLRNMVETPAGVAGMMHEAISGQKGIPQPVMEGWMKGTQHGMGEGIKKMDLLSEKEDPERALSQARDSGAVGAWRAAQKQFREHGAPEVGEQANLFPPEGTVGGHSNEPLGRPVPSGMDRFKKRYGKKK